MGGPGPFTLMSPWCQTLRTPGGGRSAPSGVTTAPLSTRRRGRESSRCEELLRALGAGCAAHLSDLIGGVTGAYCGPQGLTVWLIFLHDLPVGTPVTTAPERPWDTRVSSGTALG